MTRRSRADRSADRLKAVAAPRRPRCDASPGFLVVGVVAVKRPATGVAGGQAIAASRIGGTMIVSLSGSPPEGRNE